MSNDPRPLLLGLGWFPGPGGGLSRYFRDLVVALEADGGPRPEAVLVGPAPGASPGVHAVSHVDAPTADRVLAMARGARELAPAADMLNAHFALYAAAARLSPAVRRLPLVFDFHGPWAEESLASGDRHPWRLAGKRLVERSVYRKARSIVVLSSAFKRLLVERYGVDPWRIHVLPPAVDLLTFTPGDRAAARRALDLDLDPDAWVAVTARRLIARTGVHVLLDAWAALGDAHAVLLVTSDGSARPDLEAQAARLGIADRVRFLGTVPDEALANCYRASDVSVLPSIALEGFGLALLESLACGTPVIATDVGGLGEAAAAFDPNLVVAAGDPAALAARLAAARDGALPAADRCRAHAEQFSWTALAARHRALFARAVSPAAGVPEGERPLRVVYIDHTAVVSGAELTMVRQIPAIEGIEPHMIVATDGPLASRLSARGVSTEILPMAERARTLERGRVRAGRLPLASAIGAAGYTLKLARHLRRLRPDVVHTCSLKSALYGAAAARLAGVPAVWELQDRIADDYLPASAVRLVRSLSRRLPAAIIANSEATGATLPEPRAPLTVIPLPVERPRDDTPAPRPPGTPFRVGIVGRLSPWKGQDLFLTAFAKAFPDGDERAVIIGGAQFGEEGLEEGLTRLATDLGIADRVELRGHRDDVEAELHRLDVLVHASTIPEPFGMVIAEGMAVGLPVVAADAGGPIEIIEHGVNGLRYRMGDAGALAETLSELAADPALRARLGEAARQRGSDFFPDVLGPRYLEVYRRVARRTRKRATASS